MSHQPQKLSQEEVAAFFVEHGAGILRFLMGILRDSATANDCLQAAFAKMLEKGHESRVETRREWLFRVAYQEAMLAKRKIGTTDRVLRKAVWVKEVFERRREQQEAPDFSLVRRETSERVEQLLRELTPEQLAIVRMRIYEEKTFVTIADELNIPLGTALGRMRAALKRLREACPEGTWSQELEE